ncbi:molybdopterin molybdotransferase MoeA [Nocardioides sp. zg-ZUI104]|uniref:molybdopterin molybdotransferase MoeA n=1 Tax=Nocardioides faecalis TaxID=2803858 RepID=UPI001BCF5E35|nr:gephyrin-like molybdotransferase Glp [Nocardioides faecalis]MBS4751835.1 molybdopterin molybdotransferase MoeA [Nocardioides faecalis]
MPEPAHLAHPRGVDVAEHRARVLAGLTPLGAEEVAVADALGRVLAADVVAELAVPPFDSSAMDGFAVRSVDLAALAEPAPLAEHAGSADEGFVALPVAATVAAGDSAPVLPPGSAIRIMTGAQVPAGADLVVPFEWTTDTDPVRILRTAAPGRHIRRGGEDVAAGEVAIAAGTRVGPAQLGLLASVGVDRVAVRRRPRLAVISTGAELVTGAVPDSNTATLLAAGRAAGAEVAAFGPVVDEPAAFADRLAVAAGAADLVVTTGGVSAGDRDVVKAALREAPGFWFGGVAMKPGRPQGFGSLDVDGRRVPVITLPGTPIAAYASFLLYAVPAIAALAGTPREPRTAELGVDVAGGDRTVLLPATYDGAGRIVPLPGHAGHSQRLLAAAEALLVVPPTDRLVPAGTVVEVLALRPEEDLHAR